MSRRTLTFLAAAAVMAVSSPAFAETTTSGTPLDDPQLAPLQPATASYSARQDWYGWQTLAVDAVTLGSMPLELGSSSFATSPSGTYLVIGSLSGYALGAPIIHASHGQWRRGLGDFGLRTGAIALGALLGAAAGGAPSACNVKLAGCLTESSNGLLAGALLGAIAASIVDASVLTWSPHPAEVAKSSGLMLTPTAFGTPSGGMAGLVGRF